MTIFHGYIFRWGTSTFRIDSGELERLWLEFLYSAGQFDVIDEFSAKEGRGPWRQYRFRSPEPLTRYHRILNAEHGMIGPFDYDVLIRVNPLTGTIVILAAGTAIVQQVIKNALDPVLSPKLAFRQIRIDELAKYLLKEGIDDYAMTTLRARFVASGKNLERISFDGRDLANSSTFKELFRLLTPYYIGMRSRLDPEDVEAIRMSNRGYIAISFGETADSSSDDIEPEPTPAYHERHPELYVRRAEDCLVYISENGFLRD
ncbi:MAG: hypothetical protein H6907_00640 [Hyphomicrobiales bacterium]|nr:hypothetical protein [Hyphomicrobiales bacterium]